MGPSISETAETTTASTKTAVELRHRAQRLFQAAVKGKISPDVYHAAAADALAAEKAVADARWTGAPQTAAKKLRPAEKQDLDAIVLDYLRGGIR